MMQKLNLYKLVSDRRVKAEFSGPEWDSTLIYVLRSVAAIEVLREKFGGGG